MSFTYVILEVLKQLDYMFLQTRKLSWFRRLTILLGLVLTLEACQTPSPGITVDVLVLGAGTGATAAAIQAARSGAKTLLVNPQPWHGGMLTAAGVSATDGNHRLPAGLWGEFRQAIYDHYGGAAAVATGWVSNTHFEPKVAAAIFDSLLQNTAGLQVYTQANWTAIQAQPAGWSVRIILPKGSLQVRAKQLIDGTDLGDVAAAAGAEFDLGMDSRLQTGESIAPEEANDIVQDLTWVAILKDYGADKAPLLPEPPGYKPGQYRCLCDLVCDAPDAIDCTLMLNYARLPNQKYLINWPNNGNDYYLNAAALTPAERELAYQDARTETLRFVYFLQQELGWDHLGLAEDEFPTADHLALMPYHREGRRIHGMVQLRLPHILQPYQTQQALYRTGIAVGDYPVDHHHGKHPAAPEFDFPPVPSFSVPVGALIPQDIPNLVVADKAISVSNIVNGSTRLQPVILQVGQVAGLIGAMAAAQGLSPSELSVRAIQQEVLAIDGYLQPFFDVLPDDPDFAVLQRIGATGLLMGTGEPYQWANRTWLYPDSLLTGEALRAGFRQMGWELSAERVQKLVSPDQAVVSLLEAVAQSGLEEALSERAAILRDWQANTAAPVTRRAWAHLLDAYLQPFQRFPVDFAGQY